MATQPVAPFYVPRPADDTHHYAAPTRSPVLRFLTAQTMFGAAGQVPTKQWHYDYDDPPPYQTPAEWLNSVTLQILTSGGKPSIPVFYKFNNDEFSLWQWRPLQSQILSIVIAGGRPKFNEWKWKYTDDDRAIWRQPPQGILLIPASRAPGPTTRNFPWIITYTTYDFPVWFQQINQVGPQFTPPAVPTVLALAFSSDQSAYSASASDSPSGQNWSGAGYMAKYEIDTSIQLNTEFINSLTGVYVDPSLVTLYILNPNGGTNIVNYPGAVSRNSQGHYFYQLTPNISGSWTYKWQATGTAVATSPDTSFTVNASLLIAG
jgi:hypothetical protein